MVLAAINRSEVDDCEQMLRDSRRSASDFEISDTPARILAPSDSIGPAVRTVIVRSRRNGAERRYVSGSCATYNGWVQWVNEFADDLARGAFG
jgi:hypothetical protein